MVVHPEPDPDEWGRESFPASDPPSGWQGPEEEGQVSTPREDAES